MNLTVVPCEGWERSDPWEWVLPPSPNMPTGKTALVYPGMCLIEGTNLSEGRGTTRPFEYVGFPRSILNGRIASLIDWLRIKYDVLPGVTYLPATFLPTFQKHAGESCGGVFLDVFDPESFRPVRTGLAVIMGSYILLNAGRQKAFHWRTERYEFVDHIPAIDLLFGSDRERNLIEADEPIRDIVGPWEAEEIAFRRRREPFLLYP